MRLIIFIVNFLHPKNWPLLVYFFANGLILFFLEKLLLGYDSFIMVSLYILSLLFVTFPFGEIILRKKSKANPISMLGDGRIETLFSQAYTLAKSKSFFRLSRRVKLYYSNDSSINACALGSKTMIINLGILSLRDDEIISIFLHEFSHLIQQDSYRNVSFRLGNLVLFGIFSIIKLFLYLVLYMIAFIINIFARSITGHSAEFKEFIDIVMDLIDNIFKLWNVCGILISCFTLRIAEYKADKFAKDLGYGSPLADILTSSQNNIDDYMNVAFLTHPTPNKRVVKLLS